jgi:CDGSH-type Zn-finger protein/uncharacterized Fe-S cluster protein YjdI
MSETDRPAITRRAVLGGIGVLAATPTSGNSGARLLELEGASLTTISSGSLAQAQVVSPGAQEQRAFMTAQGKDITIHFESKRCIHARYCVLWQPHVYRANSRPWMDANADSADAIAAVVHSCPSGALQYGRHDGGASEPAPRVNIVYVRENGPLAVRANFTLDGKSIGYRATLCRCGDSKNKPFCDGSHVTAGFIASGEPPTKQSQPLLSRDGPVTVVAVRDGPLLAKGNLEICSGTARTIDRTVEVTLCRCGHSKSKPFCDGSHETVGFRSE